MASTNDKSGGLDSDRQKLSKALNHWRQWKEDYQTLKEDLNILPDSAPPSELARTRQDFVGDVLDARELIEIFGKGDSKKRDQILSVLDNRIDYVQKNISTLQKQLEAAQKDIPSTSGTISSDAENEDALPITEIMEELDDDDNVLSYSLRNPGNNEAQLIEALQKAGINDPSSSSSQNTISSAEPSEQPSTSTSSGSGKAPEKKKKKSVAFSEDTKSTSAESSSPTETAKKVEQIMKSAKEQEDLISEPVIPAYETADDAALREDMIRYNKETMLYEMAPIVAELQLEEASDIETDEYSDYDDDDDEDDEDQWGRSTKGLVDDDWRVQMEELKERLSNHTFGDNDATLEADENAKAAGIGRIAVRPGQTDPVPTSSASTSGKESSETPADSKKNVRFASNLDIAEEKPKAMPDSSAAQQPEHPIVEPLSDVVMERTAAQPPKQSGSSSSSKRPSRFKKDRAMGNIPSGPTFQGMPLAQLQSSGDDDDSMSRYAPSGPEGQVLSDAVLEHEPSAQAKEPDEFDDNLLRQQVAEEYHKARNKFIHRQGGFLKEDENPIQPLTEEEGGPKKMSRFKAARLAKS